MNHLYGEWKAVAAVMNGTDQQPAEYKDLVLKIDGNGYKVFQKDASLDAGEISLQLGGKMEIRSQAGEEKQLKAIYIVSGNTLKVCYDLAGKNWPTAMESKEGTSHYLVTYEKQIKTDYMKRLILIYGLIAGAIVAAMMFITMPMYKDGTLDFEDGGLLGYTTMVIALSVIFFGIKSFRDNHAAGIITFGRGVKVGLLITLVAGIIYALAWEVCYNSFYPDFMEEYSAHYMEERAQEGATPAEIEKEKAEWATWSELYKNPFIRFGMTLTEILPVGIVVTLLSAGLLRRKEFLPQTQTAP